MEAAHFVQFLNAFGEKKNAGKKRGARYFNLFPGIDFGLYIV
jgi:hypothetical protein